MPLSRHLTSLLTPFSTLDVFTTSHDVFVANCHDLSRFVAICRENVAIRRENVARKRVGIFFFFFKKFFFFFRKFFFLRSIHFHKYLHFFIENFFFEKIKNFIVLLYMLVLCIFFFKFLSRLCYSREKFPFLDIRLGLETIL